MLLGLVWAVVIDLIVHAVYPIHNLFVFIEVVFVIPVNLLALDFWRLLLVQSRVDLLFTLLELPDQGLLFFR